MAACTLANLARNPDNHVILVRKGAIPPLIALLQDWRHRLDGTPGYAADALCFLAANPDNIVLMEAVIPPLIALPSHTPAYQVANAADKALSALSVGNLTEGNAAALGATFPGVLRRFVSSYFSSYLIIYEP